MEVLRDVTDRGDHGADESGCGEEERPAVLVVEGRLVWGAFRLLAVSHFVVHRRDV